ncbi:hypothetical protein BB560_002540 [Smittium megazygosporum]|uniref:Uncharacterized protein n=1 Tax=Smittium megazygosporum TaxID=133381 RepID=A0A2T9ZEL4_9FUNG|nr:hypothetical protein BB560_002540 [Smittium megazygosporum]
MANEFIKYTLKGHKDLISDFAVSDSTQENDLFGISVSEDKTCRIWDLHNSKTAMAIHSFENEPSNVKFLHNGHDFVISAANKLLFFDLRMISTTARASSCVDSVIFDDCFGESITDFCVSFANPAVKIYCVSGSGSVSLVDIDSKQVSKIDSGSIVCGVFDSYLNIYNDGLDENLTSIKIDTTGSDISFNPPFVFSVACDPEDESFLVGLGDGSLVGVFSPSVSEHFQDEEKEEMQIREFRNETGLDINSLNISGSSEIVNWKTSKLNNSHSYIVSDIEYCRFDKTRVATSGLDGFVKLWDSTNLVYMPFLFEDQNEIPDSSIYEIEDLDSGSDSDSPLISSFDLKDILGKPDWVKSSDSESVLYAPSFLNIYSMI